MWLHVADAFTPTIVVRALTRHRLTEQPVGTRPPSSRAWPSALRTQMQFGEAVLT
jgi:hypothetical protein